MWTIVFFTIVLSVKDFKGIHCQWPSSAAQTQYVPRQFKDQYYNPRTTQNSGSGYYTNAWEWPPSGGQRHQNDYPTTNNDLPDCPPENFGDEELEFGNQEFYSKANAITNCKPQGQGHPPAYVPPSVSYTTQRSFQRLNQAPTRGTSGSYEKDYQQLTSTFRTSSYYRPTQTPYIPPPSQTTERYFNNEPTKPYIPATPPTIRSSYSRPTQPITISYNEPHQKSYTTMTPQTSDTHYKSIPSPKLATSTESYISTHRYGGYDQNPTLSETKKPYVTYAPAFDGRTQTPHESKPTEQYVLEKPSKENTTKTKGQIFPDDQDYYAVPEAGPHAQDAASSIKIIQFPILFTTILILDFLFKF